MIQINPLKSYIDGGVRAALTTPPSASLVFDLPGKAIWVKGVKLKGIDHTYTFNHDNYITLTNTPDKNNPESEDIKIGVNITTLKNVIDTTYNGGTLALLQEGLNTEERTWLAKILHNYINNVLPVTKNLKINGTNYAIYTTENSLPLFFVPISLGTTGQILACTSSGLIWVDLIQNTDYRVSLSSATSNSDYRIILKQGANNNPETDFVRFSEYLTFNPYTKTLKINNIKVVTATDIYVGSNAGLVPTATSAQLNYYLRGDGAWVNIATEMAAANTWRPIKVGNTDALGSGTNTGTLSFIAGTGITLSWDATNKRIIITNSSPDVNHNTDETVRQVPKTDNVNRPLMMINGSTSAGEQINTSMFSTGIYANASTKMITANGFIKAGSSDDYVLLGGGNHKAISDFNRSGVDFLTFTTSVAYNQWNRIGYVQAIDSGIGVCFLISIGSHHNSTVHNTLFLCSASYSGKMHIKELSGSHLSLVSIRINSSNNYPNKVYIDLKSESSYTSSGLLYRIKIISLMDAYIVAEYLANVSAETYNTTFTSHIDGSFATLSNIIILSPSWQTFKAIRNGIGYACVGGVDNNGLYNSYQAFGEDSYGFTYLNKIGFGIGCSPLYKLDVRGDTKIAGSIRDLAVGGGIYWNPYVESTTDGSDAASITLVKSGVAGGTTLVLSLMNDANDTILFKTNTAARLYHNSYPILTTLNTYVTSDGTNRGIINGTEVASARHLLINGVTWNSDWHWSGQSGQPTWLWGSNDGSNMYVWNPSNFSVNYANSAGSVAWDNITNKPINFKAYSGSLASSGWKIMLGNNSSPSIAIAYNNNAASWNSGTYSATLVYGCSDTRGLLDCSYNTPVVTFGGCSYGGANDNSPTWYMKLSGTHGVTYNLNSMPYALSAGNADTIDGLHYSSFLRKDTNDSTPYQYTFTKTNDHAIRVGTVRGTAVGSQTGEYIHLYERVAIGSPSGWGSRPAPSYGLATYGGAWLATDTGNVGIGTTNPSYKLQVNGNIGFGSFGTSKGGNILRASLREAASSTSGVVAHSTPTSTNALYIEYGYIAESGGLAIEDDGVTVFGSGDAGWVFRVIDEDIPQNGPIFLVNTRPDSNSKGNVTIRHDGYISASGGYIKSSSSNDYVLLGGGGHKAISDFATSGHTHPYLPLSGGTITGQISWTPRNLSAGDYSLGLLRFDRGYQDYSDSRRYFPWIGGLDLVSGYGYGNTISIGAYHALYDDCGFYIGMSWDGNNSSVYMTFSRYGDITARNFYSSSDIRLKNNINNISKSIRSFNWKESGLKSYGLIALEIENEYPELVSSNDNGYKSINYTSALCMLVAKLENGLDELKEKVKLLEDKLRKYENTL